MQPHRSRTRRAQPSISNASDEEEVLYPRYVGAAHSDKTKDDEFVSAVSNWVHRILNISAPSPHHPTDPAHFHPPFSSSTQQALRHTTSTEAPLAQDRSIYQNDLQIRRSPYVPYSQGGWPTTDASGHISYPEEIAHVHGGVFGIEQPSSTSRPSIPTNRSSTRREAANASDYHNGRWYRSSDYLEGSPGPTSSSSQHRNSSRQLSPPPPPSFQRSSSQSMRMRPANSALSSSSPTYQRMFSANFQTRSPPGSPTHNGEANIHLALPPKHHRSSSVPSNAPRSGSSSVLRSTSRPLTGPYTTGTSPNPMFPPLHLPFSPRIGSPPLASPRLRRGYWNRRGDHLTTDGYIVYAPPAFAYPAELATYPPEEVGYQNDEGAWCAWVMRPELPESLPRMGRAPEAPYESFVVYVDHDRMGSLAPHASSSRKPSIDTFPNGLGPPKRINKQPSREKALLHLDTYFDARLAALNSRRPKSPTSSSSGYGSANSARSRASSWSNSPGGHIPGTTRDVMEFPFGYPITPE